MISAITLKSSARLKIGMAAPSPPLSLCVIGIAAIVAFSPSPSLPYLYLCVRSLCPPASIYSYLRRFAIQLATGRVHRLGQEKDVEIIKLITSHTIDQHILRMAMHKKKLSEVMLTEVLSPIYIQLQCPCAFTLSIYIYIYIYILIETTFIKNFRVRLLLAMVKRRWTMLCLSKSS